MDIAVLIIEVVLLIGLAAIASGLNVALLALDMTDLKRKEKLGDRRAKLVVPLRQNTHLSLASILLMGVAVVSATSLILESRLNGLLAGLITTVLIVVFGEILPQAFFARYALTFTALFAPFLHFINILTYPLSKPLQLLLDKMLGTEQTRLASRRELGIIIAEHDHHRDSELDENEIDIIQGALSLSEKRVRDIMTPIDRVFWLQSDTPLDDPEIDKIKDSGHSRFPILNPAKTKCYGVLHIKDLVDVDFDEAPLKVEDMPLHPTKIIGSMTALDTMFDRFINARTHLMPIEKDDKIVGIVTIEDLVEEIIGHEIRDESDQSEDTKRR